jgi:hypothetical protein
MILNGSVYYQDDPLSRPDIYQQKSRLQLPIASKVNLRCPDSPASIGAANRPKTLLRMMEPSPASADTATRQQTSTGRENCTGL